jgi:hypothetical protein
MKKKILAALVVILLMPVTALAGSGYKGGFYIDNDEETFKLKFSGNVMTKFYYERQKGADSVLTFALRNASLGINATLAEKGFVGFGLKHAQSTVENTTFQTVNVTGAVAGVEIIPAFIVTVGMVGLPLSFINEVGWVLLPEFPQVVTRDDTLKAITPLRSSFGTPDGLGINFSGAYWKWFYSLSVINGAESNYTINTNKRFSFGFRSGINILDAVPGSLSDFDCSETPKLMVSLGSDYQAKREDTTLTVPAEIKYLWTSSLGAAFRWAGFAITAEGFYRRTKITDVGSALWARPNLTDIGYYVATSYYILPKKFEIALQADQAIRQGPANDSWEFGGSLNYYIFDNNMKLQLAYDLSRFFDWEETPGAATGGYTRQNALHNVTLMLTARF